MKGSAHNSARRYAESLVALQEQESRSAEELVRGLLTLLQKKRSLFLLKNILAEVQVIAKKKKGVVAVNIETAHDIPEDTRKQILEEAEKMYPGEKVEPAFSVRPELLAGFRIRSADKERDQSLAAALRKLHNQLTHL